MYVYIDLAASFSVLPCMLNLSKEFCTCKYFCKRYGTTIDP